MRSEPGGRIASLSENDAGLGWLESPILLRQRTWVAYGKVWELETDMTKKTRSWFFMRDRFLFKDIAKDRVRRLLSMAEETVHTKPDLSREYVSMAIRIGMKCKVRIPKNWKWRICRGCNTLLYHGVNCMVRIRPRRQSHLVTRCLYCGRISRRNIK